MSINRNKTSQPALDSHPCADVHAQAHLAHELANLLDGSLRNVALVMSHLREFHEQGPYQDTTPALIARLNAANEAMRQMASLIGRMMDGSSAGMGLGFVLRDAMTQASRLYAPQAAQVGVELENHIDPQAASLPAGTLFPVIINLIRNSLQAMTDSPAGQAGQNRKARSIRLDARVEDQQLVLTVEDDGPGFAPELFDETGTFKFGVTTRQTGHGMGLSLVRDIIHTMGGSLQIANASQPTTSNHPTGGRVTIRMPVNRLNEIVT